MFHPSLSVAPYSLPIRVPRPALTTRYSVRGGRFTAGTWIIFHYYQPITNLAIFHLFARECGEFSPNVNSEDAVVYCPAS